MKPKKKNSKKDSASTVSPMPDPLDARSSAEVTETSAGNTKQATIVLPSDSAPKIKSAIQERPLLRKINEMQETESLTPNASNSDFLSSGGWEATTISAVEQSDAFPPPRLARISFSEPPEDLAALDFEIMQLPPMDPTAKPSSSRFSLHFLLTSPETLPPVSEFCPRQNPNGRLQLTSMRDRPLYAPLPQGTPTRAQALLAMREGPNSNFTAGFLERTGFTIPPELDPDIPSRRESNLSQADWDAEQEYDDLDPLRGPPAPPATPGTPLRAGQPPSTESPVRAVDPRGGALDHAILMSALGSLVECGEEEGEEEPQQPVDRARDTVGMVLRSVAESDTCVTEEVEESKPVDVWVVAGMALSAVVVVGILLLRPRSGL